VNYEEFDSPSTDIISFTYKAVKIYPDGSENKDDTLIRGIDESVLIYFPGHEILLKDEENVEQTKKKLNPITNVINGGNMAAGVNSSNRLADVNAVSSKTGTNLYTTVSNNDKLTKLYSKYQRQQAIDKTIYKYFDNMQSFVHSVMPQIIDILKTYLKVCEKLDIQQYRLNAENKQSILSRFGIIPNQNKTAFQQKLVDQYKEVRSNIEIFNLTTIDGNSILTKLSNNNVDKSTILEIGKEIINHMNDVNNVWTMAKTIYVNSSDYLLKNANTVSIEDLTTQINKFKDAISNWIDVEIILSKIIGFKYSVFIGGTKIDDLKSISNDENVLAMLNPTSNVKDILLNFKNVDAYNYITNSYNSITVIPNQL
jgi:hypothetical protein